MLGAALNFGAPVVLAVGVVIAGYGLAATLVDMFDEGFGVKDSVARWAK